MKKQNPQRAMQKEEETKGQVDYKRMSTQDKKISIQIMLYYLYIATSSDITLIVCIENKTT